MTEGLGFERVITLLIVIILSNGKEGKAENAPQAEAMFVFGDSLLDNGNNNYLSSLAKANYVPYGIDFYGPSGRFCNGKNLVDFLGNMIGLPDIPAYANTYTSGSNIVRGVNYASAAGGILDETGRQLGGRYSLSQQIENFKNTMVQLKKMMDERELSHYLANSLIVMLLGSNDYINNYLLPLFYTTSQTYNNTAYADLLIKRYTTYILELHSMGMRKFMLGGIGPIGCTPNQIATGLAPPGKCVAFVNEMAVLFNERLRSLADELNGSKPNSIFVYGNTFAAFSDILNNPSLYGFKESERGCCGVGRNQGQITCLPMSVPCMNRDEYVFWDAFHPSQAANHILARTAYSGSPSYCYPINVQQMAQLSL